MSVQLYMGDYPMVKNSGVGKAILHQREMLRQVGVSTEERSTPDVDTVHINTVFPKSVLAALRARRQKKTVVYYGHSTEEDFRNSIKGSNLISPLFRKWITFCYSLGDIIITPTDYSKRILEGYGIQKPIYALSNGIDTTYFKRTPEARARFRAAYHIAEDEKVVISAGHLIERKGILDFLQLAKGNPDIKFIWFGATAESIMTNAVKTAVRQASENVLFAGFVDKEIIRDAYCGADLFAFLSHEETEGIVVLEALACSIPVLLREIPVYDGWLKDGVNCYKGRSLSDFQTLTEGILQNTLPSLAQEGLEVAENRSMREMGKKLIEVYRINGNRNYCMKQVEGGYVHHTNGSRSMVYCSADKNHS